MTVFIRAVEASVNEKPVRLKEAVQALANGAESPTIFVALPERFAKLPRSPFAYWAGDSGFQCFESIPRLESGHRHAAAGAQTRDNLRFVRAQWEVPIGSIAPVGPHGALWSPLAKGGSHRRFYTDVHLLVRWAEDGRELKAATSAWRASKGWGDYWRAAINSVEFYGRPGISWPVRSQKGFSARALGAGAIFGHKGPTVFIEGNNNSELAALLALMNSDAFFRLVSLQMAFGAYEVGVVQNTPVPDLDVKVRVELAALARQAYMLNRGIDGIDETSRAFILPSAIAILGGINWQGAADELALVQSRIDELAADAYGLPSDASLSSTNEEALTIDSDGTSGEDDESDDVEADSSLGLDEGQSLSSWLVGVAFGRFDPRLATGERTIPPEPEPFDPLPPRSPGMYPDGEEPAGRPDILIDDEGHPKDLPAHVQRWAEHVGVEVPADLRTWLARAFFPLHVKMYSKSRRKAPIYWQLATPSASYSVWLYIHAFTKDTLFRVQNDYVAGKLAHEERQLETLRAEAGPDPVTAQRKAIEAQEAFVDELRTFLDEVKRIAPLWNPNLDDGVIINFAPLWRLVPHHKPWQKELKSTWEALCIGKYDWAHLAMHLWPERVVPKCAEDRSLAIAHDLENVFWYQDDDEKWKPRKTPTRPIDALVKVRTSSAVKAALKSLLEAPEAASGTRRGRRGRG